MKQKTYKIGLFLLTAILIIYLMPHERKLSYSYSLGLPWKHELLTTSYAFPILKEKRVVETERDSVLRHFQPYYNLGKEVETREIDRLFAVLPSLVPDTMLTAYANYLKSELHKIYNVGIIGAEEQKRLEEDGTIAIYVVRAHISESQLLQDVYTPLTAYREILKNIPPSLDVSSLKSLSINRFLIENLIFDEPMSEDRKQALLKGVSLSAGYVQVGERIVDKGQLVDERTFQILNSWKEFGEKHLNSSLRFYTVIGGQTLITLILLTMLFLYLDMFRPQLLKDTRNVLFFLLMIVSMVASASLMSNTGGASLYLIPFAILPVIVRTFFDSRTAFTLHMITILQVSFIAEDTYAFILIQLAAGMAALFSLKDLVQRSQLVFTTFFVFLTYCATYFGLELIMEDGLQNIQWQYFGYFFVNSVLLLFAYLLIYIFEKTFGFLSNVTLLELSGANNALIRRFSEEAPGSFQHSLQVSNLAADAAMKIGANSFLARTGALFHDIGKLYAPVYFSENQSGGINPLNDLSYEEAAKKVIAHVDEGIKLAQKESVPEKIIDFIRSHHGNRQATYFYNSFKNAFPNEPINEEAFTYHGTLPRTKEQAIVSMADAVEAASRSLHEYSASTINNLVDKIIDGQLADGMFKQTPITFTQLETVKNVFKEKLKNIYHSRISYPELKK